MIKASNILNTRLTLVVVTALTLVACSKESTGKLEGHLSLMIDQKAVMSEKFSKHEALDKHKDLLDVFETACQVVYFFQTTSRSAEQESLAVDLREIPTTDNILTCQSSLGGPPGCSIRPRGDGDTQRQYLLALRDFLRDRQNMEESAMLRKIFKESSDRSSRDVTQLYVVKGNSLSCSDATATREKN